MCPIASPLLAVLVAHQVFAFWVGNCQKLELAPFNTCCPTSRQSIANPVAHRFTNLAVHIDSHTLCGISVATPHSAWAVSMIPRARPQRNLAVGESPFVARAIHIVGLARYVSAFVVSLLDGRYCVIKAEFAADHLGIFMSPDIRVDVPPGVVPIDLNTTFVGVRS